MNKISIGCILYCIGLSYGKHRIKITNFIIQNLDSISFWIPNDVSLLLLSDPFN